MAEEDTLLAFLHECSGRIVGIKSLLDVVSITAALIDVNAAQSKLVLLENFNENYSKCLRLLYKVNAAEEVNAASEEVSTADSEMLDQTFDSLQKLVSRLELLDEKLSQEDVNQKLLRSLSPEWNTHAVVRILQSFKRVNTFVDFRTDLVEGSSKRAGTEHGNKRPAKIKELMEIVPDEEEVAIECYSFWLLMPFQPLLTGKIIRRKKNLCTRATMLRSGPKPLLFYLIGSTWLYSFSLCSMLKGFPSTIMVLGIPVISACVHAKTSAFDFKRYLSVWPSLFLHQFRLPKVQF
ncbi:hypothetical protein Tco_0678122 [Tanacetum coccineum]|uniref:Uncharacterized protein n=1 Tax=Tanacetum coccineum TaxID=301880 RepID=A0ABQ4XF23_9ASTR